MSHYFYKWICQECEGVGAVLQLEPGNALAGLHIYDAPAYCPTCFKKMQDCEIIGGEAWFDFLDANAWALGPYIEKLLDPKQGKIGPKLLGLELKQEQMAAIKPLIGQLFETRKEMERSKEGTIEKKAAEREWRNGVGILAVEWRKRVPKLIPLGDDPIKKFDKIVWVQPVTVGFYQSVLSGKGFNIHTGIFGRLGLWERILARRMIKGWPKDYALKKDAVWYEIWTPESLNLWRMVEWSGLF